MSATQIWERLWVGGIFDTEALADSNPQRITTVITLSPRPSNTGQAPGGQWKDERRERRRGSGAPTNPLPGGISMKLEHNTIVTDGKKITTSTWHTDTGKTISQNIKSTDLKSGRVTTTNVSGGKLLP